MNSVRTIVDKWKTSQADPWVSAPIFKTITTPGKDYGAIKAEELAKVMAQNKVKGNAYKARIFKKVAIAPIRVEVSTEDFNYDSESCEVNNEL